MDTLSSSTLLIADELPLIRAGITRLCEASGAFRTLPANSGQEALRTILDARPDVALLDYHLPGVPSLEVVRRVRGSDAATRILVMAMRGDRKMALETLRAGANGFVLKSAEPDELLTALARVRSGSIYVSPQLEFEKVFCTQGTRSRPTDPMELLSSREYQVFQLLVDGCRAKEIANRLQLSPKTVDTYRASLMRKLDIHDVAGLVKYAIHRDLTSVS